MAFDLELPGVWLDALVEDALGDIAVINTTPEGGEVGVSITSNVALDIAALDGGTIVLASTFVYVSANGGPEVLAFDGSSGTPFQPGYNGPGSTTSTPQADVRRIVIDPFPPFDSEWVVTVRVLSETTMGATLDTSYSFTVEDITPPRMLTATAVDLQVVELEFSENLLQASTTGSGDSLNPANYTLTRLSAPAVDVEVVRVVALGSSAVQLETDIPLTPGGSYRVVASNVEDLVGNAIVAPFNQLVFAGFEPPVPDGREWSLWQLMPLMNRQEDVTEALEQFLAILQEPTDLILYDIDRWADRLLDPDTADELTVDAMLCDMGNPFTFELELTDKRRLLRVLVDIYKQKGTCVGIQNAVRFFVGVEVECDEFNAAEGFWSLGDSELGEDTILGPSAQFLLYSFTIVAPIVLTEEQRGQIKDIVDYMKPAHTHCIELIEPTIPDTIDHLELGLSELGENWELH